MKTTGTVAFSRDPNTKEPSIRVDNEPLKQKIVYHSPTGMEFGYGGSGPADTALNLLYLITDDRELAFEYHQAFKFKFVGSVDMEEGGTRDIGEMVRWLEKEKARRHEQFTDRFVDVTET